MKSRLCLVASLLLAVACGDTTPTTQQAGGDPGGGDGGDGGSSAGGSAGKSGSGQGGKGGSTAGASGAQGGSTTQGGGGTAGSSGGAQGGKGGSTSKPTEDSPEACTDGQDNDGDKYVDCDDSNCCQAIDCAPQPSTYCGKKAQSGGSGGSAPKTPEDNDEACSDEFDNDGDGYTDCDDFNCSKNPSVTICGGSSVGGSGGSSGSTGGKGGSSGSTSAGGSGGKGGSSGSTSAGGSGGKGGSSGSGGKGGSGTGGGATGPGAVLTPGNPARVLLVGTVLTPEGPIDGQVLVDGATIACVAPGDGCAGEPAAADAAVIETKGIISPGLIDTHNHILFDIFDNDDWSPAKLYPNHNEWPKEPRYEAMLDIKQCFEDASQGKPKWCIDYGKWDGTANNLKCEMNKWGELKGLVAGTTSIVGLPGTSAACFGSLSRSIDVSQNDLPCKCDKVRTSALFPPSSPDPVCESGDPFLAHVGEGIDEVALAEWAKFQTITTIDGCLLASNTAITHGTAFGENEFKIMGEKGMKLTWSPRSNVSLYGTTTDIPTARKFGIVISLAPDWSMGGSVNLLDELRFADEWDNTKWGDILSPKELFEMATVNAALVVGHADVIGSIKPGYMADLFVFGGDTAAPYDALLGASPSSVRLVMVGGKVLYGDPQLKAIGANTGACEDLDVCGVGKFVCAAEESTSSKFNQTFGEVKQTLEDALLEIETLDRGAANQFKFAPLAPLTTCP